MVRKVAKKIFLGGVDSSVRFGVRGDVVGGVEHDVRSGAGDGAGGGVGDGEEGDIGGTFIDWYLVSKLDSQFF